MAQGWFNPRHTSTFLWLIKCCGLFLQQQLMRASRFGQGINTSRICLQALIISRNIRSYLCFKFFDRIIHSLSGYRFLLYLVILLVSNFLIHEFLDYRKVLRIYLVSQGFAWNFNNLWLGKFPPLTLWALFLLLYLNRFGLIKFIYIHL